MAANRSATTIASGGPTRILRGHDHAERSRPQGRAGEQRSVPQISRERRSLVERRPSGKPFAHPRARLAEAHEQPAAPSPGDACQGQCPLEVLGGTPADAAVEVVEVVERPGQGG